MEIAVIVISLLVVSIIGRVVWEKLNGCESQTTDAESREWYNAIK